MIETRREDCQGNELAGTDAVCILEFGRIVMGSDSHAASLKAAQGSSPTVMEGYASGSLMGQRRYKGEQA